MRVLITGSRGFIGSSLGRYASQTGHDVLGLGLASQPVEGWQGNYLQMNVATSDFSEAIKDFAPDVVLHAAGTASVRTSWTYPLDDLKAAALTWANTLESVRRSGLNPLIFFPSSAAVYGNPREFPMREDAPVQPISPYGFHKAACELLAREYVECFGLRVVVCRLFSVFGAAQRRLLIWELFRQFAGNSETVWLEGTGKESRDYLHIDDVASALFSLALGPISKTSNACDFVNVASGKEIAVLELARRIGELTASKKQIQCRGTERLGDPRAWRADIGVLRSLAPGWQPTSLTQGLAQCISVWTKEADS